MQAGFTDGSEKLLNNAERYALVVATMQNTSYSEQQSKQRKSRPNIGKDGHMTYSFIEYCWRACVFALKI